MQVRHDIAVGLRVTPQAHIFRILHDWSQIERQLAAALGSFLLLIVFARNRLSHPGLWAEDSAVFFSQALKAGGGLSLWLAPHAGYYQVVPRLVTAFAMIFPLRDFAMALTGACFAIYAAVASTFSRDSYRWLIRSDGLRFAVCMMWTIMPGLSEVLGNVCNLHTPLFMYLAILAWRDLSTPLNLLQLMLAWLAMGSEGGIFVLLPVYVGRLLLLMHARRWALVWREALALTFMVGWSRAHWETNSQAVQIGMYNVQVPPWRDLVHGSLRFILERFALFPVLGRRFYESVRVHDLWRVWAFGPFFAVGLLVLLHRQLGWRRMAAMLAIPGTVMGLSVVTWVVRVGALEVIEHANMHIRYTLATGPFALILWVAAAERCKAHGRGLATAMLLLFSSLAWPYRKIDAYDCNLSWPTSVRQLEQVLGPVCGEVSVPASPAGWTIVYRNDEPVPRN